MNISIDIDNIIADFEKGFRKYLNKRTNKKLKKEDIHEFEFYKSYGISEEQERRYHDEFIGRKGYTKLKRIRGSKAGIKELSEFAQIAFISARTEDKREITLNWLNKNNIRIEPNQLFLTKDKLSYVSQFDIIIEDRWEDALRIAQDGKTVILFDYPWNRKRDANGNIVCYENIFRVGNWEKAIECIDAIAEIKFKKELREDVFKVWKECISVQMHFNQLIMRNRITFASVLFAAFSAAMAFLANKDTILKLEGQPFYISDVIMLIAVISLASYAVIDVFYYFRLLLGAVNFTEKMDKEYKTIGLTASITRSIGHKKAIWKLIIHYLIFLSAIIAYIVARVFLRK
jgi:uncharacterized HAD superfamily protein